MPNFKKDENGQWYIDNGSNNNYGNNNEEDYNYQEDDNNIDWSSFWQNYYNGQYENIYDLNNANNEWSAEQAQKQMDFQERMNREQNAFNSEQAAINREFQQNSARESMNFSAEEAAKNRQWQEYMSSTAHQREMSDLKAAGLNPVLAANGGAAMGSGSAGQGASASGSSASSTSNTSGAKANASDAGIYAMVNILGKIMDANIEREKMQNSAEIAYGTADMYTSATRYAAELAQIASMFGSELNLEGTKYHADRSYDASTNNPWNLIGEFVNEWLDALNFNGGTIPNAIIDALDRNGNSISSWIKSKWNSLFDKGSHYSGKF